MPILGSSASQSGKLSGVPTIGTATASGVTATVTFTAPAHVGKGGSVTYTATSSPGGFTGTSASSPITVSGLTAGSSYTFTVTATNAQGTSAASSASNSITAAFLAVAAYYAGGNTSSSLGSAFNVASISRIQFSNDALSTISATLGTNSGQHGTTSNSGVSGYWTAGDGLGRSTRKIAYAAETTATIAATVDVIDENRSSSGTSNSGTAGYLKATSNSTLKKLAFSNDTMTTLTTSDMQAGEAMAAVSNSGSAGYYCGAFTGPGGGTSIRKITFSNDVFSTISAGLNVNRSASMGMSNSGTAGYVMGGLVSGATVASVEKITFSNESRSNVSATLSDHRYYGTATGNKGVAGYQVAGASTTGGYNWVLRANLNKVNFSNDTISALGSITQNWGNRGMSNEGSI